MSDAHDPHDEAPHDRDTLDSLVREARSAALPVIDWKRVDAGLFERVKRDAAHARALAAYRGRARGWVGLAGLAAASVAAAVAIQPVSKAHAPRAAGAAVEDSAGDLTLQQGSGDVRLDGAKAQAGARARGGETVATEGARALFEWGGRVSWLLENDSKVTVERATFAGCPLILALATGAVEAQVAPVASGEAFAIDVEGVRVAVHGTHLRVARDGDRVVVDLSEGTVSIGAPPKFGSTYGTLVTAPAHVEFRVSELAGSIVIDHDAASVRSIAELSSVPSEGAPTNASSRASRSGAPATGEAGQETREEAASTPSSPRGWTPRSMPRATATAGAPNPLADALVASAVRACATAARPHSTDVTVTVSSTLTVDVQDDGFARLASFDPPLAPDLQACASQVIYATRFVNPGPHKITIALER